MEFKLDVTKERLDRAIVSYGNQTRLNGFLKRAQQGDNLTIAALGGSITFGAAVCSEPEKKFHSILMNYFRHRFPKSNFTLINAGIGATGSLYGTLRVKRDVLEKNPDLVLLDFAVNDEDTEECAQTYEGLVRKILHTMPQTPLILLFMSKSLLENAQDYQERIGLHYQLPMISFRDAIAYDIKNGALSWEQLSPDEVHPNAAGHQFIGELLCNFFDKVNEKIIPEEKAPLFTDRFERTALYDKEEFAPTECKGFKKMVERENYPAGWFADTPGSYMDFEFEGDSLFISWWTIKGPMGKISIQVDKLPPKIFSGFFTATWGGMREWKLVADNLALGKHRAHIELLSEKDEASSGNSFLFFGFGCTK